MKQQTLQLVADSGSTKTDWAVGGQRVSTQGINPIHQDDETIARILHEELIAKLTTLPCSSIRSVRFYGSGVRPEQQTRIERLLGEALPSATDIEARSDLLGAARALSQGQESICCILGTGANSCLFDGKDIVANTPALGYILGDEGSGAVLGIRLLNGLYKGALPKSLLADFEAETGMTIGDVIDRVYRQPLPNRWLASLSPFVHSHLAEPAVEALVVGHFRDFIRRNILPYQRPDLPIHAVGSIAWYYQPQLQQAIRTEGYRAGIVLRSPIERLV